jgi:acyl carrier protein
LAAILIDLLGIDRVGRNDTFMSIGGESILATQFVNRIQAAFGVDVPIDAFFYDEATLVELARIIDDQRSASPSSEAVGVILR